MELSWQERAACLGMDIDVFFHEPGTGEGHLKRARDVCDACPVREECAEYAYLTDNGGGYTWGVLGGLSPTERRHVRAMARALDAGPADVRWMLTAMWEDRRRRQRA